MTFLAACGDDDAPPPTDSGVPSDLGPSDGGGVVRQITYTPEGCGYEVISATGRSAALHSDVLGATPAPDHLHASFSGPATTTFAVNWRTVGSDTLAAQVLYGTDQVAVAAADGPGTGVSVQSGHSVVYDRAGAFRIHEAHVCGLTASTRYFYKVGGPGAWSSVFDVSTSPAIGTTEIWRFALAGDSRDDPGIFAETQLHIQEAAVDLEMFSGDAVIAGINQPAWDSFFEATSGTVSVQDVLARIPFMVVNGNHDSLAVNYLAQFAMPQQVSAGEDADGEQWYSFDYANAHFAVLDDQVTAAVVDQEATWLRADLAAVNRTTTPWIIVVHHSPMYTTGVHTPDLTTRAAWQPIFDEFSVDLVLNGHNHSYERSAPIRDFAPGTTDGVIQATGANGIPVAGNGTMYVVSGGAGAPLYAIDPPTTGTIVAESTYHYVIIEIEGKTMRYHAYRLAGTDLDVFEYTRP
jgi:hypothetical protein